MHVEVRCANCNVVLNEKLDGSTHPPCPNCGSVYRHVLATAEEEVPLRIREDTRTDIKDPSRRSKDKLRRQILSGDSLHHKTGKWMKRYQEIDKDADRYRKIVSDLETGEVLRDVDEPLTDHQGRGSAKGRPKSQDSDKSEVDPDQESAP